MSGSNALKRFTPRKTLAALAVGSVLFMTAPAAMAADKINGSISGQVALESGSSVANATVEIRHNTKGITRSVKTNENGQFIVKSLPIGTYTIRFVKDGLETVVESEITVSAGSKSAYEIEMYPDGVERIQVTGSVFRRIDMESSEDSINFTASELAALPVAQDLTSVALLAPGTALGADGDGDYGNLPSFGGASVAENGYFLNGMNITDIRKGLGNIQFPWEAIAETSVISGGVPAQYGQFIGGVTNVVARTGDNEFSFGASAIYSPGNLSQSSPDVWRWDYGTESYVLDQFNGEDTTTSERYNIWASGPIIEDKLFFYALLNPQRVDDRWADTSTITKKESTANFWFANVDWYITDNHSLLVTAFNNEWEKDTSYADYAYNPAGGNRSTRSGPWSEPTQTESGGSMWSASYTGLLTDDLTLKAQYGVTEQDSSAANPTGDLSRVWDSRSGSWQRYGDWSGWSKGSFSEDKRTQYRVDLEYMLDDHTITLGYSHENVTTSDDTEYSGDGRRYDLYTATQDRIDYLNGKVERQAIANGEVFTPIDLAVGDDYYWSKAYSKKGTTEQNYVALYLEDTWTVTDQLTLNLGLRYSEFDAYTGTNEKYVDMDGQFAPRLGINYDLFGDGETKLFANYGRYFMPVSPNTSARMTLPELNREDYGKFSAIDPTNNAPIESDYFYSEVNSDGDLAQPVSTYVDGDLDPMYSDEYAFGVSHELNEDWVVGLRYTYTKLLSAIEDTNLKYALVDKWGKENPDELAKLERLGLNTDVDWLALVINPGSDVKLKYDVNEDGTVTDDEFVSWDADYLGLPKAERTYKALELTFAGNPNEDSHINFSYTFSESKGTTEGLVSGTHSQADPGWSGSYDSPELMDNSYGRTSNDIPHKFKLFGSYNVTDNFSLGFFATAQSGRPVNMLGYHPQGVGSCAPELNVTDCTDIRGTEFYYQGQPSSRGSHGHSAWIYNLDVSASYVMDFQDYGYLTLKADVFNVLNLSTAVTYDDVAERENGDENINYRMPTSFQTPQYVQLSARYDF